MSPVHPVVERRMHNSRRYYVPSMHGPWYKGTWYEEITTDKSLYVYALRPDGKELLWSVLL